MKNEIEFKNFEKNAGTYFTLLRFFVACKRKDCDVLKFFEMPVGKPFMPFKNVENEVAKSFALFRKFENVKPEPIRLFKKSGKAARNSREAHVRTALILDVWFRQQK